MSEFKMPYDTWIYFSDCSCPDCVAFREAAKDTPKSIALEPIKYLGDSDPVAKERKVEINPAAMTAPYGDADKGLRFNAGKVPLELIPPEWLWGLALVMRAGIAKGYPPNNWMKGMEWSKCVGSMKRHTARLEAGEWIDAETGQPHAAMAAWNALALLSYSLRGLGTNDLFPPVNLDTIAK